MKKRKSVSKKENIVSKEEPKGSYISKEPPKPRAKRIRKGIKIQALTRDTY